MPVPTQEAQVAELRRVRTLPVPLQRRHGLFGSISCTAATFLS